MKMELIQPFINAADAVLSQAARHHQGGHLSMEEKAYQRKGVAGMIGRYPATLRAEIVLDLRIRNSLRRGHHFGRVRSCRIRRD